MVWDAMIVSRQNQRIRDAVRLRDRRHRERERRFLIEGFRELERAIGANIEILETFVAPDLLSGGESQAVLDVLSQQGIARQDVSRPVFEKLAYGDRLEGVIAVARMAVRSLDDVRLSPRSVVAILDGIEKPGNLGAIARSADAAGIEVLISIGSGTDVFNPNAIRASMGALFTVPTVAADAAAAIRFAKCHQWPIFAARPDADRTYTDADFSRGAVFVLGSEAQGLGDLWRGESVEAIRIPMCGLVDSLNVSVTAAVLFYEALRQRGSSSC